MSLLKRFFALIGLDGSGADDQQEAIDNVELIVRGPDGAVKRHVTAHNLVTTVGKEKFAERQLASPGTEGPKFIAVGTGTTAVSEGQTALVTEIKRKEATTRSVSGKVLTLAVVFTAGEATGAVTEEGLFSASTTGSMYARTKYEAVNVAASDSLEIKHTVEFA
jgi:hypothetical protein